MDYEVTIPAFNLNTTIFIGNRHESVTFTPELKKSLEYDGHPHQGLSEAQRGKEFFLIFLSSIHCGGVPSGEAIFIVPDKEGVTISTS
jgi:hypothetical protein